MNDAATLALQRTTSLIGPLYFYVLWAYGLEPMIKRPSHSKHENKVPSKLAAAPTPEELEHYAEFAAYYGSGEHKSSKWEDVLAMSRREKQANVCPATISTRQQATALLKAGILAGNISEDFVGGMPKRVWYKGKHGIFEARLTDQADFASKKPAGYKGWPEVENKLPQKPHPVGDCDEA